MSNTNISSFRIAKTPGFLSELDDNGRPVANTEAINHSLNQAHERGIENLIVPADWTITKLEDWTSKNDGSSKSFTMHRKDDQNAAIRLWKLSPGADAKLYREALLRMLRAEPTYTTAGGLAIRYLKEPNKAQDPKWVLQGELAETLKAGAPVFNAILWGVNPRDRKKLELTQYDRNKSYLPAIGQAIVAPLWSGESYHHYNADAPISKQHAGMYLVEVPEWPLELPSVYGNAIPGQTTWVDSSMVRFVEELRATHPEIPEPVILEAFLAPAHKTAALQQLAEKCKELLAEFSDTREEQMLAKEVYKNAAGAIASVGAHRHVYRPDWASAIKLTSWTNVLRTVYRVHAADPRFVPVAMNVDAVYYPPGLPEPPGMKIGTGLGQFKLVVE